MYGMQPFIVPFATTVASLSCISFTLRTGLAMGVNPSLSMFQCYNALLRVTEEGPGAQIPGWSKSLFTDLYTVELALPCDSDDSVLQEISMRLSNLATIYIFSLCITVSSPLVACDLLNDLITQCSVLERLTTILLQ